MTHLRLWRFQVPVETEERFVAAYKGDGVWATLFATADGFIRTDLWRAGDGAYLTADYWNSAADFERFQADRGDEYRQLDTKLEGVAGIETYIGAFNFVD